MVPFALAGTALWALALLVINVGDLGTTARDTALAGIATGVLLTLWSHRMDRKLP